jgi:hypothetical protein
MYIQLTPTYKGEKILFGPFNEVKPSPEGIDANYENGISIKLLYNETTKLVHYGGNACTLEIITENELQKRDKYWQTRIRIFNPSARFDVD